GTWVDRRRTAPRAPRSGQRTRSSLRGSWRPAILGHERDPVAVRTERQAGDPAYPEFGEIRQHVPASIDAQEQARADRGHELAVRRPEVVVRPGRKRRHAAYGLGPDVHLVHPDAVRPLLLE